MPNGKVKRPANFFPIFFRRRGRTAGRPFADGLWPLAFGGLAAKKSPRHRLTFAGTPIAGERLRRVRWVTNPRARTFAPWRCGAYITYIISSRCQANPDGNPGVSTVQCGQAFRRPDRPPGDVPDGLFWPPCGLRSILLHNKYFALSSFARH